MVSVVTSRVTRAPEISFSFFNWGRQPTIKRGPLLALIITAYECDEKFGGWRLLLVTYIFLVQVASRFHQRAGRHFEMPLKHLLFYQTLLNSLAKIHELQEPGKNRSEINFLKKNQNLRSFN